jgi:hypothetical protein
MLTSALLKNNNHLTLYWKDFYMIYTLYFPAVAQDMLIS